MMKSFPESYPYLTKGGILLTEKEINTVAKNVFEYFGHRALEFGLELTYLLMWVLDNLKTKDSFERVSMRLFSRVIRNPPARPMVYRELDDNFVDARILNTEEKLLMRHDLLNHLDQYDSIEGIMETDKHTKRKLLLKLKNRLAQRGVHDEY